MLSIKQLNVEASQTKIISNLDLEVPVGEVYALMGPNGSGKSTFAQAICGHHAYNVTGRVSYFGEDLLAMAPHIRAQKGLFIGFQHPIAIPGLNNLVFMHTIYNQAAKIDGREVLDAEDFMVLVDQYATRLGISGKFWERSVNDDFSGGERKRNDLLQMLLLDPKVMILDEIDSGLDVDGLKLVASIINEMREKGRTIILITHYPRLLEYVRPNKVCILKQGKLVHTGTDQCVSKIEQRGYQWLPS
ncbi:Fe-S cluster assembly ATPase SufC [Gammaproteobacteria bacterium]|nr:Fe-S cluster assembly ATPase SufC [Gammaproteobacteria bacterium]